MLTKNACTVLNAATILGDVERKGRVNVLGITGRSATERVMAPEDRIAKMLNLWHALFGYADRRVIKHMAEKELVRRLDLNEKVTLPKCGPCAEATMPHGPMKYRTALTSVPGTVIHTDVAEMNVMPLGSANYSIVFIDEASENVCAAHLKSKGAAASHLEKYVNWEERQTGNMVKQVVLDGRKEYLKAAQTLVGRY